MTPTATFTCNICSEPSGRICIYCTKDACANHLCDRCQRCSDCCECEVRLEDHPEYYQARVPVEPLAASVDIVVETSVNGTDPLEEEPPIETAAAPEPQPDEPAATAEPEAEAPPLVVPVEPELPPRQE